MIDRAPDYTAGDPLWVRQDKLWPALSIGRARMSEVRRQLGNRFEHRESDKPNAAVWIYYPLWLPAYERMRIGAATNSSESPTELRGKPKQEFFDGEIAEAKYRVFIGELVAAKDVTGVFSDIANEWSSALTAVQRTSPESADRLSAVLESAKQKVAHRFNGHSHENGSASASGHSDRHARSIQAVSPTHTKRVRRRRGRNSDR